VALRKSWVSTLRTKDSVVQAGRRESFYEIIEASRRWLAQLRYGFASTPTSRGLITEDTAQLYCTKKGPVTRGIDNIKKRRGNHLQFVAVAEEEGWREKRGRPPPNARNFQN